MTYKTLTKLAKGRSSLPILNTVKITGGFITSTDLDMEIRQPYNSESEGLFIAKGFEKGFMIKSDKPIADFPDFEMYNADMVASCTLKQQQLEGMEWVAKAQSLEETSYYLNGIAFYEDDTIVATDGHRLHKIGADICWFVEKKPEQHVIVQRSAITAILSLRKELEVDEIYFSFFGDKKFSCKIGEAIVRGRLIDGIFPAYKRVMPSHVPKVDAEGKEIADYTRSTQFDHEQIKKQMPYIKAFKSAHDEKSWSLGIKLGSKTAVIKSQANQFDFPIIGDFELPMGFNARYLAESCSGIAEYTNPAHPMLIRERRGGIDKVAVLMPLRL